MEEGKPELGSLTSEKPQKINEPKRDFSWKMMEDIIRLSNILLSMHSCEVASVMSYSVTPWAVAHHAPLSMGFSREEY